jgi:hypothetical protein
MENLWRCAAEKNSKQLYAISETLDELDGKRQTDDRSSIDAMFVWESGCPGDEIPLTETREVRKVIP